MFCPLFPMHIHNSSQPGKYSLFFPARTPSLMSRNALALCTEKVLFPVISEMYSLWSVHVQECFVFNSIAHDQCQIFGCCVMFSVLILSIQAIGVIKYVFLHPICFAFRLSILAKPSTLPRSVLQWQPLYHYGFSA